MDFTRNTKEICKGAYARMGVLTKLKYVGPSEKDLITIHILYIVEYCSVVWHSSLTQEQSNDVEKIQKISF